ncbi:hypothetical protein [Microbulbifer magnicolonia]|uniref:hypothetical protein n=1 Tax=Microbulbifer magnicolonia TaxID=3109744 RepID=UPI002B4139D7|nr:hypothetical protein [Microbulbifer sp. GG15]
MMMRIVAFARLLLNTALLNAALWSAAAAAESDFYANQELQRQMPGAFALQPQARGFLKPAFAMTIRQADALVAAIEKDQALRDAIARWPELSIDEQIPHLKRIFALETAVMEIAPPKLVIDNHSYPGRTVYFDFDPQKPSTGTVYLNPDKLAARNKYDALAFLIHETRHSYQFQLAYADEAGDKPEQVSPIAEGYRSAFEAQKTLKGFSFSDFLTLLNEYEAFQFANYVVGKLTDWQLEMTDMGTFASQFDREGRLKIDLIRLSETPSDASVLERYNRLAKAQYEQRARRQ